MYHLNWVKRKLDFCQCENKARFVSDLVGNPEDRFFLAPHLILYLWKKFDKKLIERCRECHNNTCI